MAGKSGGAQTAPRRNIILFADGTGNSSRSLAKTNVWRLYEAVVTGPPAPGDPIQLAYYIDGVGTSSFKWLAYLGQAFGFGLARKIKKLYEFLCRHYQPGDHIYVFGFSRGAFTARVLVDLVASCGIVDRTKPAPHKPKLTMQQERGFRLGIDEAYRTYRHRYWRRASPHLNLLNALWERVALTWRKMTGNSEPFHSPDSFMKKFAHEPVDKNEQKALRCIGVWDTVDAYGMPVRELAVLIDRLFYPYQFRDQQLSPVIHRAFQALALDDKRRTFHPLLWDERSPLVPTAAAKPTAMQKAGNDVAKMIRPGGDRGKEPTKLEQQMRSRDDVAMKSGAASVDARIRQVWFCGMHADVGGGYPESGLAMVAVDWMAKEVVAAAQADGEKIAFKPEHLKEFEDSRQATGLLHDSRAGLATYFRYGPRDVETLCGKFAKDPQVLVELPKIHRSVFERIAAEAVGYAPVALPGTYEITEWGLASTPQAKIESPAEATARMAIQARNWHHIFWRAFTYYGMLFPTLVLLAMPAIHRWAPDSVWDWFAGTNSGLSDLLRLARDHLPAFGFGLAKPWLETWAQAPTVFLGMLLLTLACYWWSGWFVQRNVQHFGEAALRNLRELPPTPLREPRRFELLADKLANGGGWAGWFRKAAELLGKGLVALFVGGIAYLVGKLALAIAQWLVAHWPDISDAIAATASEPMVLVLAILGIVFAGIGTSLRA